MACLLGKQHCHGTGTNSTAPNPNHEGMLEQGNSRPAVFPSININLPCLVIIQTPKAEKPQKINLMVELSSSIMSLGSFTFLTKSPYELVKLSRCIMNLNSLPLTKVSVYPSIVWTICPFIVMNLFPPLLTFIKNSCSQASAPIIKMALLNALSKLSCIGPAP